MASARTVSSRSTERWVVRLPPDASSAPPVTHLRGSLVVSGRGHLRATGAFGAYEANLSSDARAELEGVIAASWLPIRLAHAHFEALDRVGLDESTIVQNTNATATKLHGVFLTTAVKALGGAGATPEFVLAMADKLWVRLFQGGAVGVQKAGPKDARVVILGDPLVRYRYHRVGFRVHIAMALRHFTHQSYVREESSDLDRATISFLLQWV
jgi:hypothetical protein